jgi:phage baseplate assembly protein W
MALTPENETDILDEFLSEETESESQPTKTYYLDFENGRIGSKIDGEVALKQFVIKAIMTPRSRYAIYSDDYGCELKDLIGEDVTPDLLNSEIPRMIREALVYDDRISDVTDITVEKDGDKVYVSFTVVTTDGDELNEEVTLDV